MTNAKMAQRHYEATSDSGHCYTQFKGWVLTCAWCEATAQAKTKADALALLQLHYDTFAKHGYVMRVTS